MDSIVTYLMDDDALDILVDDSEIDDLVLYESDDEEEDDTEEELEIVFDDSDESNLGEEEEDRPRVEAPDSEDSDGEDDAPTAPKQRCIQNTPQANNGGAGTSRDAAPDDAASRPSTSRQHHSVDLRHSVQLQLAPQPTLYQQDEQLEPQPIRIQARSFLESSSSLGVLSSAQLLEQGIVVVPQLQQLISADLMQSVSNQSTLGGGGESHHRSRNGQIHYLHLYPREE